LLLDERLTTCIAELLQQQEANRKLESALLRKLNLLREIGTPKQQQRCQNLSEYGS